MINIYSDEHQSTLKYLKETKVSIHNVFVMTGDFNIRDRDLDPSYPHYSAHSNILIDVADFLELKLSFSVY